METKCGQLKLINSDPKGPIQVSKLLNTIFKNKGKENDNE